MAEQSSWKSDKEFVLKILRWTLRFPQASITRKEEERQLFDAFTELGAEPEMSDVSFAFEAQAAVALRD